MYNSDLWASSFGVISPLFSRAIEFWERLALLGVPPLHVGRATASQSDNTQALVCSLSTVLSISLCCPTEALIALSPGLSLSPDTGVDHQLKSDPDSLIEITYPQPVPYPVDNM